MGMAPMDHYLAIEVSKADERGAHHANFRLEEDC